LTMSCPIFWIKNDAGKYLPTPFSVELKISEQIIFNEDN